MLGTIKISPDGRNDIVTVRTFCEIANDHLLKGIYSAQQTNKHGPANSARAGYRDVRPPNMNIKASEKGLQKLRDFFDKFADISEEEWAYFSEKITGRNFPKNHLLFRAGEPVIDFFFIINGLVRYFYLTEDGKEFNKAFAMEHNFVGSFSSMVPDIPCRYSVQALEKTETLVVPVRLIQNCYDRHPAWERVGRQHAERVAVKKEKREGEFLLDSAETRYRRLLAEFPTLTGRIQQYHIASYLGITDVALSRIRTKIGLT